MRVQFTKGKHYEGKTFAPGDVADVSDVWGRIFVASGAAKPYVAPDVITAPGVVQDRMADAVQRDPVGKRGRR